MLTIQGGGKHLFSDMSINNSTIEVLQDHKWVFTPWKKLQVGDIVKDRSYCSVTLQVKQDAFFSADILFLASTNPNDVCYIEVEKTKIEEENLEEQNLIKLRIEIESHGSQLLSLKKSSE